MFVLGGEEASFTLRGDALSKCHTGMPSIVLYTGHGSVCVCVHAHVPSVSFCVLFTSLMAQYRLVFPLLGTDSKVDIIEFSQDKQVEVGRRRNQVSAIKSSNQPLLKLT